MCSGIPGGAVVRVRVLFAEPSVRFHEQTERLMLQPGGQSVPEIVPTPWDHRADVDACIAEEVEALNDLGITTYGACCGNAHEAPPLIMREAIGRGAIIVAEADRDRMLSLGYSRIFEAGCCRYAHRVHSIYPAEHFEVVPIGLGLVVSGGGDS